MTDKINAPFCPLYREACNAVLGTTNTNGANAGLLFDKFANAWRFKRDRQGNLTQPIELEFDKGIGSKKEGANRWLNSFAKQVGDEQRLKEACQRQHEMVHALGGKVICLTNTSRFVTGMGREHPLENGFVWHNTLGVPYLPGSSLKGVLRSWLRETKGEIELAGQDKQPKFKEDEEIERWFGTPGQTGQVILLDMLPTKPPKLAVDVMTPHYTPYYQGKDFPGDWHSPNPIHFLVVEVGASWQVGLLPVRRGRPLADEDFQSLGLALLEALEWFGAGAKTAVGYGEFERDTDEEARLSKQQAEKEQQRLAAQQVAAEQKTFEAELANASPQLQELLRREREQNWQRAASDQNMISALITFAEEHPQPPQDCLDWVREWIESIPKYDGVWDDPDAMRGKAKNRKYKYTAEKIREIVKKLNPGAKS